MLSIIGSYTVWLPLLATAGESGEGYSKALSIALSLLSLMIFFTCGVFRELAAVIKLPPILGDLIAGVVIGVSGLHFLMLESGGAAEVNLAFVTSSSTQSKIRVLASHPHEWALLPYASYLGTLPPTPRRGL
ncbi:MAG: hypothetical protein GVY04_05885, partial [Cyanobacteria bacterium]|nr:hypothetical protein [Cyanobacteria bacterium GSL.Bin1]